MAGEDYRGIGDLNISQIVKQRLIKYGQVRWYNLYKKYEITKISENNNLILFSIGNIKYYYGIPSQKIRRKGNRTWYTKIVTELKKDFNNDIPLRQIYEEEKYIITPESPAPGKYKGHTWLYVLQNDPNYVNWFISVTDKEDLKQMLQEMVKTQF